MNTNKKQNNSVVIENGKKVLVLRGVKIVKYSDNILLDNETICNLIGKYQYDKMSDIQKLEMNIARKGETQAYFDPHTGHTPVYGIIDGEEVDVTIYTEEEIKYMKDHYKKEERDDDDFFDRVSMEINEKRLDEKLFYVEESVINAEISL